MWKEGGDGRIPAPLYIHTGTTLPSPQPPPRLRTLQSQETVSCTGNSWWHGFLAKTVADTLVISHADIPTHSPISSLHALKLSLFRCQDDARFVETHSDMALKSINSCRTVPRFESQHDRDEQFSFKPQCHDRQATPLTRGQRAAAVLMLLLLLT